MLKKLNVKVIGLVVLFLCFLSFSMYSAIVVTSPSSAQTIKSAEDYASLSFQDPWNMDYQTDLGWFIFDKTTGSKSNLTNISFTNSIFSATSTNSDPNISILETGVLGTAYLGKIGTNYPIDAGKFTTLAMRMKLPSNYIGQLFWSRETIYDDMTVSGGFNTYSGWRYYFINIPDLSYSGVIGGGKSWGSSIGSLRFDPVHLSSNVKIEIDWMKLVNDDSSLYETIQWTGASGNVDIYLDNDTNSENGNLGKLATNVSGSSYELYAGGLDSSVKHYIAITKTGGSSYSYSKGYYQTNDFPTLEFTSPSEEGGDDFATVKLGNSWDMNSLADVDHYKNITGLKIASVTAEDNRGISLGSVNTLTGTSSQSATNIGDPHIFFLNAYYRGASTQIDSSKYRILVLKMGIPGDWDLVKGSVARIVWMGLGETKENVSEDIEIRHKKPTQVISTIIADMKTLPIEAGAASPSHTGWNGMISSFRVDPHEFPGPTAFYIKSVKLAAYEQADTSYTIKWDYNDNISTSNSLALYYDSNKSGFNGILIKSSLNPNSEQYVWDTSEIAEGEKYIYAVFSDGLNTNKAYAKWPIIISHTGAQLAEIALSRSSLIFAAIAGGKVTNNQKVLVENNGSGTMNWTTSPSVNWLTVSPSSGSDAEVLEVSVNQSGLSAGTYTGHVSVSSDDASNSPKKITVHLTVYSNTGSTSAPIGVFATPLSGANVSSSIPVTGWALDDVEVTSVKIYRNPISGEGASIVYIGDALFVDGARPDIETAYSGYPLNYRAGWGYMLLTNFLPNNGNGTFVLRAIATNINGKTTEFASKTITVDNANAVKPFGAIDTPSSGGTASGNSYTNWGWALTPQPNTIPTDGSTLIVYIDGVKAGNVTYNIYRSDIAELFPDYKNKSGAAGKFYINTSSYDNGVHTIEWQAKDDENNIDGIGSRYFTISNTGSSDKKNKVTGNQIISSKDLNDYDTIHSPIDVSKGFNNSQLTTNDSQIKIKELQRIIINLNSNISKTNYTGYLIVGDKLRKLPIGSTLRGNKFYWNPGPGFIGEYDLVFIDHASRTKQEIKVIIEPKFKIISNN